MKGPDGPGPALSSTGREAAADLPIRLWEGEGAEQLAVRWRLPEVHLYQAVGSTNDLARALGAAGAPAGTLVLAEEQRSGRGRGGRSWASPPGLGLWCSFVCRPADAGLLGALPLRVGLAAATALDDWAGPGSVLIKWPNDLRIGTRKLGGILCEATWEGSRLDHLVVGIGLNLLHRAEDFPEPIRKRAISLRLATDVEPSRLEVAGALVEALRPVLAGQFGLAAPLAAELARRDALRDREIQVLEPESGRLLGAGQGAGIDPDGSLLLATPQGTRQIRSGSVRISGEESEA